MEGILEKYGPCESSTLLPNGSNQKYRKGWTPFFFILHDNILMFLSPDKSSGILGKIHLGISKIVEDLSC